jgi:hypothetical protein
MTKEQSPENNTKDTSNDEELERQMDEELVDALNQSQSTPE